MRRTAASLFVLASLAVAAAANAQSFNCGSARYPDEHVICKDPYLSKLDEQLSSAFARMFDKLPPRDQKELAEDEDDWVASRHQCGADSRCIAEEYRNRIRELTGTAPPPGRPNPPVPVAASPEPPRGAPPPMRQAGPEPERLYPPAVVEPLPGLVTRPPFAVVERPPQPPFPVVERPLQPPVVERALPPVQQQPPPRVIEHEPSAATELRPPVQTEPKSQTKIAVREPQTPDRETLPPGEMREQPGAERRPQGNQDTRPQPTAERKLPATGGSGTTNAAKDERQERKSASREARRTTGESNSAAEPDSPERSADTAKPNPRPHRKPKQDHAAAAEPAAAPAPSPTQRAGAAAAAASAAGAGSTSAKPSIQWVDPPPAR